MIEQAVCEAADHSSGDRACSTHPSVVSQADGDPARADLLSFWSTPAAIGSAILSSACCWLPLVLLAFGMSAGGVGGGFESMRPFFLVAAVIFLGAGFYFAYVRKPACKPGDACAAPNPKIQRFNRVMLCIATVFVIAVAMFPYYSPALIRAFADQTSTVDTASAGDGSTASVTHVFRVEGMTCAACAAGLEVKLAKLPGVAKASVSYDDGTATLTSRTDQPDDRTIRAAVEQAGFKLAQTP
jgi:copper chaperone CopZ